MRRVFKDVDCHLLKKHTSFNELFFNQIQAYFVMVMEATY